MWLNFSCCNSSFRQYQWIHEYFSAMSDVKQSPWLKRNSWWYLETELSQNLKLSLVASCSLNLPQYYPYNFKKNFAYVLTGSFEKLHTLHIFSLFSSILEVRKFFLNKQARTLQSHLKMWVIHPMLGSSWPNTKLESWSRWVISSQFSCLK